MSSALGAAIILLMHFLVQDQTLLLSVGNHLYLGSMTFHRFTVVNLFNVELSTLHLMTCPDLDTNNLKS